MKIVHYDEKNNFVLTDKEFVEAMQEWAEKRIYYCERLGVALGHVFKFARTPVGEENLKIYINPAEPTYTRYFKQGRLWYVYSDSPVYVQASWVNDQNEKELVLEEEFLNSNQIKGLTLNKKI